MDLSLDELTGAFDKHVRNGQPRNQHRRAHPLSPVQLVGQRVDRQAQAAS